MDIKAILLDFDGTTLQRDQVFISVRNMYAIRKALDKGIYIVPSTGRAENMQPPQIEAEKRIRYSGSIPEKEKIVLLSPLPYLFFHYKSAQIHV